jgi:hypothetical protein
MCISSLGLAEASESNKNNTDVQDVLENDVVTNMIYSVEPGQSATIESDGVLYCYTSYSNVVDYLYDGETQTMLATLEITPVQGDENLARSSSYTTLYTIYDNGRTGNTVNMTGGYFIVSCAKGESKTVSTTINISTKFASSIESGAKSAVASALKGSFTLSGSSSYSITITRTYSGPGESSSDNSRSFYYKKGYDEHNITVVKRLYNDYTGVFSTSSSETIGYAPIYQSYSTDSKVS